MNLSIFPGKLQGKIRIPESKSELHRALICAALSGAPSVVCCSNLSSDVEETAAGLRALGTSLVYRDNKYYVNGIAAENGVPQILCRESGSTLRFLLGVSAALGCGADFLLGDRLKNRPISPLLELLSQNGCIVTKEDEIIRLRGKLQPGCFFVETTVTSQYLSGLLLVLPLLPGSLLHTSEENIVSKSYVNLTCMVMERFGIEISCRNGSYSSAGTYKPVDTFVPEGDWSAASFWLTANALGSDILLDRLNPNSIQGDRRVVALIKNIRQGGAVVDLRDIPDLLPPLAVLAAVTGGRTEFVNGARLKGKESDRILAVNQMIQELGGSSQRTADGLIVTGSTVLRGGTVDSFGDHRIAMAAAVAATACQTQVTIRGAESISKSYPMFWEHYQQLGGIIHV